MGKLILLYFGTIFLAWMSQRYYPVKEDAIENERHFMHDKTDIFCVAIIVWLTLFNGLKTSYNDTGNYISFFRNGSTSIRAYLEKTNGFEYTGNPLFYLCQAVVRGLTDNYHIWFLIVAFFNACVVVKFFKRYSVLFPFSLVVFYSIGTYVMYIAAMKQSVAVAVLMCAIPFLLKHKWTPYYLLVIVALFFHTHAFMFLVLPLFLGRPWTKITYIAIAAVLFAMTTYDVTLGTFMEYAQSIGANVMEIEVFDGHTVHFLRVVVYAVPTVISFVFKERVFRDTTQAENLIVNMSILSCLILSIGLVEGGNLFARMAGYFEWATAISLPWMLNKLFAPRSRNFIYICAGVLYFGYFLYEFTVSKNFGADYRAISIFDFVKTLF